MVFKLPLVSVVIVNYNYGRFVNDAVLSVYNQNYDNIECFVVDNKSTDNSRDVLEGLKNNHPDLQVIYRDANEGQCIASAEAFVKTSGQYIVFMDADDVLLTNFVSTQVFVNLSLYVHVGFTFSDMMQVVGDQIVVSTSRTQRPEGSDKSRPLLRPFAWEGTQRSSLTEVDEQEVLLIDKSQTDWCWTATSAFMFRRDAVELFIHNPRLRFLPCAFDVYLARGINAITGSVAVNRSLCFYRMHTGNIFSRHAQLERCYNFEAGGSNDQSHRARQEIIDHMFENIDLFKKKIVLENDFINAVYTVDRTSPRLSYRNRHYPTHGGARLLQNFGRAAGLFGTWRVLSWCLKFGVPLQGVARAVSKLARPNAAERGTGQPRR